MLDPILHDLKERVKELTLLHKTAKLLHDENRSSEDLILEIVNSIPAAWQYPDITSARISFDGLIVQTEKYEITPWKQTAEFVISDGRKGLIEVIYLKEMREADEGPFLNEERDLISSVADMLRTYFQHKADDAALKKAYDGLEQQVKERTAELNKINATLRAEIDEHLKDKKRIDAYQNQLRKMASDLSLTEEKERRTIAADLHDHIGQALAFIKMQVLEFQSDSIFCGQEENIGEILKLVNQTISYTRTLTFEISSPVLYELGLGPAIEWLKESFEKKHKLKIKIREKGKRNDLPDEVKVILFKSTRELLINAVKHANTRKVTIEVFWGKDEISILVRDFGIGFTYEGEESPNINPVGFGLFSIKERLTHFGGSMLIESKMGEGSNITLRVPLNDE